MSKKIPKIIVAHIQDIGIATLSLINGTPSVGPPPTPVDLSVRVSIDSDDALEFPDFSGFMQLSGYTMSVPTNSGFDTVVGLRFQNITIPQGANINTAVLELVTTASETANSTTLVIHGEDIDDAPTFTTTAFDITSRTTTTASESLSVPPTTVTADEPFDTGDISDIIQEIVNRVGWSSGNDMVIILSGGSGALDLSSYTRSPSTAPLLKINYDS